MWLKEAQGGALYGVPVGMLGALPPTGGKLVLGSVCVKDMVMLVMLIGT